MRAIHSLVSPQLRDKVGSTLPYPKIGGVTGVLCATQTRRTDLWVFTPLLSESNLFCVFLFLKIMDGGLSFGRFCALCSSLQKVSSIDSYIYLACVFLMVYGEYLCISLYFWLIELLAISIFYELVWSTVNVLSLYGT